MEKTIRVGMMPGRINEFAVEVGTPLSDVLQMAGLDATGYDIKVDGEKASIESTVQDGTSLVLLVKQVKGNAEKTIRVGMMPGRINEFAVETGTRVAEVLAMAGLDATGYDVKIDGEKASTEDSVKDNTSLILLVKQVKGNK